VSDGRGELIARHLSRPSPGRVYEVWLRARNRPPRPAGVLFSVGPNGSADVGLPVSLRGISQVMVTSEPVGGSPQPTRRPVIIAQVT
jgi:anti-sigma-K factor RskA